MNDEEPLSNKDKEYITEKFIKYLENNCSIKPIRNDTESYIKLLILNSNIPEIRNSAKPYGEKCIYFDYTENYVLKFVEKTGWNGYLPVLITWNLCIIDIDIDLLYNDIVELIEYYYPNDLFYIHETNKGYHLFLMSRLLEHNTKESIKMKISLLCDPAHGSNSIYTGNSIRLCLKENDRLNKASIFIGKCGKGILDEKCASIYTDINNYLEMFKICNVKNIINCKEIMKYIYDKYLKIINNDNDMGSHQINVTMSCYLKYDSHDDLNSDGLNHDLNHEIKFLDKFNNIYYNEQLYNKFLKYKVLKNIDYLILNILKSMSYNNLYRIIESNNEYAYGCHVQESLFFIVYKNLLVVDYDNPSRLKIISEFCRYHPEYKFRIVKTRAGYHCFLTSHKINYKDSYELLSRLCSDPMHILSSIIRGYSIRVNQKHRYEQPYKEICTYGKGTEIIELVDLYKLHLNKYKEFVDGNLQLYRVHLTITKDMLGKYIEKNNFLEL